MGQFPNPDTQFKPGNPGGPGAPKGTKHISTWIQEMLNDEEFTMLLADPREGYKEHKGPPIKAIVRVATIRAAQGEKESREWLAKYGYGQKLVHSNDPDSPMPAPADKTLVDAFIEKLKDDTANKAKPD